MDPILAEALERFEKLYADAINLEVRDPSVMALATADATGRPSVRMVNLRAIVDGGFTFFTNLASGKGQQLSANPRAALCFYWESIGDQVILEGAVERLTDSEADKWWGTRPRESQLASWASRQSEPVADRQVLKERYRKLKAKYDSQPVPRPEYWAGFRLLPDRIEFWRSGWHRLSERVSYRAGRGGWEKTLLNP